MIVEKKLNFVILVYSWDAQTAFFTKKFLLKNEETNRSFLSLFEKYLTKNYEFSDLIEWGCEAWMKIPLDKILNNSIF